MADQTQRIEEIIKRTRIAFIADTTNKMEQIRSCFQQWEEAQVSQENLIDMTHRYVHSIKGLALTLQYPQIHNACEQVLAIILQQESHVWTISDINLLQKLVDDLQVSVKTSFAS